MDQLFQCLVHSWYLSVEFRLFLALPPLVYLIWRYGKKWLLLPIAMIAYRTFSAYQFYAKVFIDDIELESLLFG